MKRIFGLLLVAAAAPSLAGCVAGMAASAIGMAANKARGTPVSNADLQPEARAACAERAGQYGTVQIIDVEQHSVDKMIVWGTVSTATGRQSFQCDFGTRVTRFTLRPIAQPR